MKLILESGRSRVLAQDLDKALLNGLDEAVAALSPSGVFLAFNDRFATFLRQPRERLRGSSLRAFLPPGGDRDFLDILGSVREGETRRLEAQLVPLGGDPVPVFLSARRTILAGKPAICLMAVELSAMSRARTVSRIGEEQLRQSQKMEAVGRLASGVAHDFNNFLTAINGFSAFLLDMVEADSPLRSGLLEISRAGERAACLTKQLLAFGRKESQALQLVDANAVVSDMHGMLARLIGEDVELVFNLEPDAGSVMLNPGQLEQIILNLALNARDAMPEGGRLEVETSKVDLDGGFRPIPARPSYRAGSEPGKPFVLLRFSDNGAGMDEEARARIFEPFFTTKKKGRGTGLGLSTVYGIVKQNGGHIALESERGRGTVFLIYLPRRERLPKPRVLPKGNLWPAQYRGHETVLVVEDEYSVRKMVRHLLAGNGYLVLEASDGAEALALIREYSGPIHLLLTDVVMPNLNGRRLAEEVARSRPEIRVLYMSGYTGDAVMQCGVREAEPAFLPKPFTPLALAQKIRASLEAGSPVAVAEGSDAGRG